MNGQNDFLFRNYNGTKLTKTFWIERHRTIFEQYIFILFVELSLFFCDAQSSFWYLSFMIGLSLVTLAAMLFSSSFCVVLLSWSRTLNTKTYRPIKLPLFKWAKVCWCCIRTVLVRDQPIGPSLVITLLAGLLFYVMAIRKILAL